MSDVSRRRPAFLPHKTGTILIVCFTGPAHGRKGSINGTYPSTPHRTTTNQFNGSPSLNLEMISRTIPDHPEDPLTDEHFLKSHRRAERKEKQVTKSPRKRLAEEPHVPQTAWGEEKTSPKFWKAEVRGYLQSRVYYKYVPR